jgi:hypothetical protein
MILTLAFLLMLSQVGGMAQKNPNDFVLDSSNPYVYLKLDRVGPRKPAVAGEPTTGLWIRIVNNCRVPILVQTIKTDAGVDGITVLDHIATYPSDAVVVNASRIEPAYSDAQVTNPPAAHDGKAPDGYDKFASDVSDFTRILPGSSLLFSVPINHVIGDGWYMRVRFSFDFPNSKAGPYSYADSFTIHVPPQYLQNGKPDVSVPTVH